SKQYVVNDAGSNLYLGFYERTYQDDQGKEVIERKYKDIGLIELIETLKQDKSKRLNPLPDKIYDNNQNEFVWKFTLSPLDLVYVPTEEEIENPLLVDFKNLTKEQVNRIYKYVDGAIGYANFIPFSFSKTIKIEGLKMNDVVYNGEVTLSTKKDKQQRILKQFHNAIDDTMVKEVCWKLKV